MKFRRNVSQMMVWGISVSVLSTLFAFNHTAFAEENKSGWPERALFLAPQYSGIVISEGEPIDMDLILRNKGKRDEDIHIKLTKIPEGWNARIKTFSHGVTGVFLESGKRGENLSLQATPDPGTGPGMYRFEAAAQTLDGKVAAECRLDVKVEGVMEDQKFEGVTVNAAYPELRGPTGTKFEFTLVVNNRVGKDTVFNLTAQSPENWDVNFKPAYEDKFVSSLIITTGQQKNMAVVVDPSPWTEPGEYVIPVKVSSDEAESSTSLKVILTGTYKLETGTADGLLSLDAFQGKEANISIYARNSGSAPLDNVTFLSVKPENWKVTFQPETIARLNPGEMKQVEVIITPAEQALVGDYSVGLSTRSGKQGDSIELRLTVKASSAWAWLGIGIILFVMAALVILFLRLGRR